MGSTAFRRRLQVCRGNRLAQRGELLEILRAEGFVVEMEECLDQCTRCDGCAFALAVGRFQFAPTADDLVRRIRRSPRGNDR